MPFLKDNDQKKKKKNPKINNAEKALEIINSVLYYIKRHILKFFALLISYYFLIARRKGTKQKTEMIGGMEVPALKDNYDLTI
tara:strand:+ start:1510 stop:1758 length:249 start_codon:yes stop_codon:yes gene_type:complete